MCDNVFRSPVKFSDYPKSVQFLPEPLQMFRSSRGGHFFQLDLFLPTSGGIFSSQKRVCTFPADFSETDLMFLAEQESLVFEEIDGSRENLSWANRIFLWVVQKFFISGVLLRSLTKIVLWRAINL